MSLNEEYHKSTGLHSHYVITRGNKRELLYTRKYTLWLELYVLTQRKIINNINGVNQNKGEE